MDTATLARILDKLPALIQAAEVAISESGRGEDKLNAVLQAIVAMVPLANVEEFMQKTWPRISAYVSVLVEFYKAVGFFRARKAS